MIFKNGYMESRDTVVPNLQLPIRKRIKKSGCYASLNGTPPALKLKYSATRISVFEYQFAPDMPRNAGCRKQDQVEQEEAGPHGG